MELLAQLYGVEIDDIIERRASHRGKFISRMINKYLPTMPELIQGLVFGLEFITDFQHIRQIAQLKKLQENKEVIVNENR